MNKYIIALLVTLFIFINGCKDKVTGPSSIGGNVICYEKSYNNYWEIYTNNITGSNPQNISNYSNDDEYPQWSPDGRYIVYSRSTSIYGPLVIVYDTKNRTECYVSEPNGQMRV
jgi:Tol biopolymer transport system component